MMEEANISNGSTMNASSDNLTQEHGSHHPSEGDHIVSVENGVPSVEEEQLGTCLRDLFAGPSRGIEEAFGIMLGMMKSQEKELETVRGSVYNLRREHKEELRELTEANEAMRKEAAEENQRLAVAHSDLMGQHEQALVDMQELSEAINTLAYNFGFGEVDGDSPIADSEMESRDRNASIRSPFLAMSFSSRLLKCRPSVMEQDESQSHVVSMEVDKSHTESGDSVASVQHIEAQEEGKAGAKTDDSNGVFETNEQADEAESKSDQKETPTTVDTSQEPTAKESHQDETTSDFENEHADESTGNPDSKPIAEITPAESSEERMSEPNIDRNEGAETQKGAVSQKETHDDAGGVSTPQKGNKSVGGNSDDEKAKPLQSEAVADDNSVADSDSSSRPTTPAMRPSAEEKSVAESASSSRPTTPATRPGSSHRRRASVIVTKQKLEFDQTLAVRLGKLESAQRDLEVALKEVNEMKMQLEKRLSQTLPSSIPGVDPDMKGELTEVQARVGVLEDFLDGFGVIETQRPQSNEEQCASSVKHDGTSGASVDRESLSPLAAGLEMKDEERDSGPIAGTCTEVIASNSNQEEKFESDELRDSKPVAAKEQPSETVESLAAGELSGHEGARDVSSRPDQCEKAHQLKYFMRSQESRLLHRIDELAKQLEGGHNTEMKCDPDFVASLSRDIDDLNNQLMALRDSFSDKESLSILDSRLQGLENECVFSAELDQRLDGLRDELASISYLEKKLQELRDELVLDHEPEAPSEQEQVADPSDFRAKVEKELQRLRISKADRSELLSKLEQSENKLTRDIDGKVSKLETNVSDSLNILQEDISSCRQDIDILEERLQSSSDESPEVDGSLDERIKEATEAVQASLLLEISERLEGLKAVENEVERLALKLADKPDQDQIDAMLRELEKAFSQRANSNGAFEGVLDHMKIELRQKTTRTEVLALVRHFLNEAKQDAANHKDSLMVGRAPVRCLGCNQFYPQGVNNRLATKVNHRALPSSGPLTPSSRRERGFAPIQAVGRSGGLRPLQAMSHSRGRPRSTGALRRNVRSASLDSRRPWRKHRSR